MKLIIIERIQDLREYIVNNSHFSEMTVNNVIAALGFPKKGAGDPFKELSAQLESCAEHGADSGYSGFIDYSETTAFFRANRQDITNHMEATAAEFGTDIFSMVQNFGVFQNQDKPTPGQIGKALWDSHFNPDFTSLYNVFAWYALEEVSRTWYMYLEEHPSYRAELSA